MGLVVTGEKRTQDTHSVCPSGSPMVYLHSPSVFHSLIVLSRLPDTICVVAKTSWSAAGRNHEPQPCNQWHVVTARMVQHVNVIWAKVEKIIGECQMLSLVQTPTCRLSTEKATDRTSFAWPMNRRVVLPLFRSHSRSVASQEPDSANCPSEEITTSCVTQRAACHRRPFADWQPRWHTSRVQKTAQHTRRCRAHGCWWWPQQRGLRSGRHCQALVIADLHEVGVAAQRTPCKAVLALLTRQVPDDDRLVPAKPIPRAHSSLWYGKMHTVYVHLLAYQQLTWTTIG